LEAPIRDPQIRELFIGQEHVIEHLLIGLLANRNILTGGFAGHEQDTITRS